MTHDFYSESDRIYSSGNDKRKQIYEKEEHSTPILIDDENLDKMKIEVIKENLAVINNKQVRHDYMKTAFAIFSYVMRGRI